MTFWKKKATAAKPSFSSIHEATVEGDIDAVRQFLETGTDVEELNSHGAPPLHYAAAKGRFEIVRLLVERGANVNFLIKEGGTPLMSAATGLQPNIIEFLLSKGGDARVRGQGGRSPLTCIFQPPYYVAENQLKCMELLFAAGAEINERTDFGSTPLMHAAWYGNREAVENLLQRGANPVLRDSKERTAAMQAFERGHDELAKLLKQHAELFEKQTTDENAPAS